MRVKAGLWVGTVAVVLTFSVLAWAEVETRADLSSSSRAGERGVGEYMEVSFAPAAAESAGMVLHADLSFSVQLPVGAEVELWPVLPSREAAWTKKNPGIERRLWVVDAATGSLVRFDVTDLVREGLSAAKVETVLVRLNPDTVPDETELTGMTGLELTVHRVP